MRSTNDQPNVHEEMKDVTRKYTMSPRGSGLAGPMEVLGVLAGMVSITRKTRRSWRVVGKRVWMRSRPSMTSKARRLLKGRCRREQCRTHHVSRVQGFNGVSHAYLWIQTRLISANLLDTVCTVPGRVPKRTRRRMDRQTNGRCGAVAREVSRAMEAASGYATPKAPPPGYRRRGWSRQVAIWYEYRELVEGYCGCKFGNGSRGHKTRGQCLRGTDVKSVAAISWDHYLLF